MQIALGSTDASALQTVPGGEGWSIRTRVLMAVFSVNGRARTGFEPWVPALASFGVRFADNYLQDVPRVADIDVWTVGMQGIYVRRGRRWY
jgi:hypothetical protein